jgi:C4-dicarboxylate-binding protein DctP
MISRSVRGTAAIAGSILLGSAALAGCGGSGGSASGSVTIKMAIPTGPDAPIGRAASHWAEQVEKASDGKVKVDIFDSGSLVPGTETLAATQDGRVGVGVVPNAYHPDLLAALSVVATPYVTDKTIVDIQALNDLQESNDTLKAEYEELGVKPLFYVGNGAAMAATKEPITTLDDIDGLRLRALATTDTMVKPLGGSGSFIEFADVYESIQRNVIDGAFPMDMGSAASASLNEVAPNLTVTGQGTYTVSVGLVSLDQWDDFSDDVKAAIEAADTEYNEWVPSAFSDYEAEVCKQLLDAKANITVLPEDQQSEWQSLVEGPINDLLVKTAATGGISADDFKALQDDYRAKAAEYEKTTDYEDGATACAAEAG